MVKYPKSLPKPSGPFQIGRVHLNFIDEDRVDPSPPAEGKKRDIPIIVWYPTDDPGKGEPVNFVKQQDLETWYKLSFLYKLIFPKKLSKISTNSYEGTPLSVKSSTYPVLLFHHGGGSIMEQNTILMEHLASHGYIVISVGHPYDGIGSYPDGRSIPIDKDFTKGYQKKMQKNMKYLKENVNQFKKEDLTIEEMRKYTENFLSITPELNDRVEVSVDDAIFIANILEKLNNGDIKSQFENKLALEKGIGIFGHSYGGVTSILTCCMDDRFKCAINLDGGMFGGLKEKYKYKKPSMYMDSDNFPGMNKYFYSISEDETYYVFIKDSMHFDYSDLTYLRKSRLTKLIKLHGKIKGSQMIKIVNDYVQSYFDKYIKGIEAPTLDSNPYEEVVLEKKKK